MIFTATTSGHSPSRRLRSLRKHAGVPRDAPTQGVTLEGKDSSHIIPRSRGGPGMPWHDNPLDANINRSLQANGLWWKMMNYPLETMSAWAKYASSLLIC